MVLQVEKLPGAVKACVAFLQRHTAAKFPPTPAFEGMGHSVAVTQKCLYRWKERHHLEELIQPLENGEDQQAEEDVPHMNQSAQEKQPLQEQQ